MRKFVDRRGIQWRVWSPEPGVRVPSADECPVGGLCFESALERRRIITAPKGWESLSDGELALLADQALPVPTRRVDETTGDFTLRQDEMFEQALTPRSFTTPDNRLWLVDECPAQSTAGEAVRTVLRFTTGDTVRELDEFPADWARFQPGKLIELALMANPVHGSARAPQPRAPDARGGEREPPHEQPRG
jgi:hypothetical protein